MIIYFIEMEVALSHLIDFMKNSSVRDRMLLEPLSCIKLRNKDIKH